MDASIVKLQVHYDSNKAITTAKLLLQNNKKLQYFSTGSYNSTVYCTADTTSYYKSANCSEDPSLVVYCPGTATRTITAVCPARQYLPQCLSWNGVKYYQDPSCQRVTYSPTNTSCECSGSTSYVSRRQLAETGASNKMVGEFSASASIEIQAFVSTWSSAADLSASSITDNYYIVMTVSLIAAFFIAGFFYITSKKYLFSAKELKVNKIEREKLTLGNSKAFFANILPQEFKFRPWYANFWIKLLECHPHLAYFAPANGRRLYHTKKWLCFCFEILFFIFMDSIFAPLATADDTTCAVYTSEATCVQPLSFDISDKLCTWSESDETCYYNVPQESFRITIIVVLVATLCSQPLASLAEYLIDLATARTIEEAAREEEQGKEEGEEEGEESTNGIKKEKSYSITAVHPLVVLPVLPNHDSKYSSQNLNDGISAEDKENQKKHQPVNVYSTKDSQVKDMFIEDMVDDTTTTTANHNHNTTTTTTLIKEGKHNVKVVKEEEGITMIPLQTTNITTQKSYNNNNNNNNNNNSKNNNNNNNDKNKGILATHAHHFKLPGKTKEITQPQNTDDVMTLQSMIMLGARLDHIQRHMDICTPEEELEWLLKDAVEMYETDIIADASATLHLLHVLSGTIVAADQHTAEINIIRSKLLLKIMNVRARAEKVVSDLQEMETDERKEKYLIKKFIVELKKGVYKKVIFRHFFELEEEEEEGDTVHWLVRAIAIFALFCLAFGCLFYILLTGISLGQDTTILWLEVLAIGAVQDVFPLKPLGIWFRFIAIASIVSDSVRHVTDLVHDRVSLIMRRTRGVVRHNSLLVQHFNAACRAARAFPHLQTSRLLIALNDYDLPKSLPQKRRLLKLFLDILFLLFVLVIILLTLMPEVFQDTIIEASMTAFINFPIYALLLLSNLSIALPIIVVLAILVAVLLREYFVYKYR